MSALTRHVNDYLAVVNDAPQSIEALPAAKQAKQQSLVVVMRYVRRLRAENGTDSLSVACAEFQRQFNNGELTHAIRQALATLRPTKRDICPDRATLYRWDKKYTHYLQGDSVAAAPRHKGRVRKEYGWEARAIHHWQTPNKPAMSTVALWLRVEGFESATDDRVRRYLKTLPSTLGEHSQHRMGKHFYNQNLKPYVIRDNTVLPVGFVYEGDGHTCDVYVAHPFTGNPWRPEFTVWIDVRSHYVVGWYLSEAESGINTLFSLSHAITHHDHVPAGIHVDPGSGFKNRMMCDDVTGYYARLSMAFMPALPGNAKGKGLVEGFFHHFEERCGKRFATYCGHVRSDDYLRHLSQKVKRGDIRLPTLEEYRHAIADYIDLYNTTVQRNLGCAPLALWQTLERTPIELAHAAIIRPREKRTVRRWRVQMFNRFYQHEALAMYNGTEVIVEYNLHDMTTVWIYDDQGRYICDACQVDKKPALPDSRIEELRLKRLEGQIDRKLRAIEEDRQRAGLTITHDQVLDDIEVLNKGAEQSLKHCVDDTLDLNIPLGVAAPSGTNDDGDIDITITNY